MAVGTVLGVLFHKQWQYKRGWLFREGSISTKRELVSFRNLAEMYWEVGELLLDTPDGLDLGGLGVRTPLSPVLVVSTVVVRLQDVLVATVPGILVAHPAGRKGQRGKQGGSRGSPSRRGGTAMAADCPCCSLARHLRAALDLHGAHFVVGPAHGLQRGVVVSNLPLAADEVVFLENGDLGFLVILWGRAGAEREVVLPPQRGWEWQGCHSLWHYSRGFPGEGGVQTPAAWSSLGGWEVSAMPQLLSQAGCPLALVMYSLPRNSLKSFKKQDTRSKSCWDWEGSAERAPGVAVFSFPNLTAMAWDILTGSESRGTLTAEQTGRKDIRRSMW